MCAAGVATRVSESEHLGDGPDPAPGVVVSAAFGDRRRHDRLEVVGDLRATFGAAPLLRMWNIGLGGALVESEQPLPLLAVYEARLAVDNDEADVHVRIRHVRRQEGTSGHFVMGVEFLGLSAAAVSIVQRLMMLAGDGAPSELN